MTVAQRSQSLSSHIFEYSQYLGTAISETIFAALFLKPLLVTF